ncbi:MAG: FtsW/RodA/SpoVE family cell cycle protein [Ruminococcaceae bacterium]|nr:FtsW/RodA/SpoVE family cell cycle protein [Oscillospiraceae bacterium]
MSRLRIRPVLYFLLLNLIGFVLLFFYKTPYDVNILYAGAIILAVNIGIYALMYWLDMGDVYLFLMVSILISIGIIMLLRIDTKYGYNQVFWFCTGIIVFLAGYLAVRLFKHWDKLLILYVIISIGLFIATLVFGETRGGSKNWISIGGRTVQPSEFIKITYVFALACFFTMDESKHKLLSGEIWNIPKKDIVANIFVYVCLGFMLIQKEWGTAIVFFLTYFVMMFLYDTSKRLMLINGALAFLGAAGGYFLTDHIKSRVVTWLDPWVDATNKGFQITQSLFAITSGGYFGTGLGNGTPHLIPEVHSDFIFAAICEEMGIFTGIAIIMIYFIYSYRGFKIGLKAKNEFLKALTFGLVISFAFQTFIIVGGVIKLIPLTGITLPFVSYGGSSMVSCCIMTGILTAVSYLERKR